VVSPSITRRRLLIGAGALGAAGLIAGSAAAGSRAGSRPGESRSTGRGSGPKPAGPDGHGTLVLLTLYGGNDGLNTVIPYTDSTYHAARPSLGYPPDQVLPLANGLGLNPQLKGLKALWDAAELAVVRGVGYPNPSLSHFQSMDIWQTASPTDDTGVGWVGRWLDATSGQDPLRAVSVGPTLPTALRGANTAAAALTSAGIRLPGGTAFNHLYSLLGRSRPDRSGLAAQVASSAGDLLSVQSELGALPLGPASSAPATSGPSPTLTAQLGLVAELIKAGAPGRIYQASLSTFDTHVDEKANHERLLGELDAAVTSFFTSLRGSAEASKVVLMTYSEFGRRVSENAGGGTDHGAAAPLFVVGPSVKGRAFYGEEPSLTDLDSTANLRHNVDFRQVYATMLEAVVGVDSKPFLGGSFPTLPLI
jgi:uncharacterized protein (DUF1501 family)